MPVYLGPYNDPLDALGKHHWDSPHAPDWRNAAITATRMGDAFNIDVAVQNSDLSDALGFAITLYAAFRTRPFDTPADVDTYITKSVFKTASHSTVAPSPWLNQTIPARTSLGDHPWRPPTGTVIWTPSTTPPASAIFVIVLTVQSVTPANATQDPFVAVWVGP